MTAEWVLVAWFSNDGPGGEHRFVCMDGLTVKLEDARRFADAEVARACAKTYAVSWAHPVKVDDLDAWVIMKTLASEVGGTDLREFDIEATEIDA